MYKNLALFNGIILAIMVFFNGMLSNITGPYVSTLIYHITGLTLIIIISLIRKNKISDLRKIPVLYYLSGVLGVATILLNNVSIPRIGVTLCVGTGLFGQLVMSSAAEHFGFWGIPVNRFRKGKILGFSMISLGIIAMIIM